MPSASTWLQIQQDCKMLLAAAKLPGINGVVVQKMSSIKEGISLKIPVIVISPYGDPESEPLDFEGGGNNIYPVEVCVIAANNLDLSPDDQQQGWLEATRRALLRNPDSSFRATLPNVSSVWDVNEETAATFDRSKLSSQYSYQSIIVRFHCNERTN